MRTFDRPLAFLLPCVPRAVVRPARGADDRRRPHDAEGQTLCTGFLYTHDSWDQYWEGTLKRGNGNIGTVTTQSVAWMGNYGITDRLNVDRDAAVRVDGREPGRAPGP